MEWVSPPLSLRPRPYPCHICRPFSKYNEEEGAKNEGGGGGDRFECGGEGPSSPSPSSSSQVNGGGMNEAQRRKAEASARKLEAEDVAKITLSKFFANQSCVWGVGHQGFFFKPSKRCDVRLCLALSPSFIFLSSSLLFILFCLLSLPKPLNFPVRKKADAKCNHIFFCCNLLVLEKNICQTSLFTLSDSRKR